jgi:2-dehydropantoate 2-reductase
MDKSDLSFLVVGAGAIGGITAALLKKNGCNVEIVCKYEEYATLITEKGIRVSGKCGDITVRMAAFASPSGIKEKKDIILLATKATDMMDASHELLPLLKNSGYIISLQNGICESALGSVFGMDRVIGCVTGWGATMESPGNLIMTSTGEFILGYPEKRTDDFLISLAQILSSIVPVRTTDNILGHLYSKLIINSCITSLGAICGLYLGKMLSIAKIRRIFIEIVREAMDVADMMKIKVEIFGGKLDFRLFQKGSGKLSRLRCHLILLIIGYKFRKLKSSSLQSLERGKPAEIDFLNGYIVDNGNRLAVSVPVNARIVSMIHEIERKEREIGLMNFDDTFFDRFNK